MKFYIGSDHAGFNLKQRIIDFFSDTYTFQDCGCYSLDSVDYPDISNNLCQLIENDIKNNIQSYGILICGTGIGMSISSNKFLNIRCALIHDSFTAEMAKKHNNANVIALGARVINFEQSINIINTFLNHTFEGGRHLTRINKIITVH